MQSEKVFIGNLLINGKLVLDHLPAYFDCNKLIEPQNVEIFKHINNNIMEGDSTDIKEIAEAIPSINTDYLLGCIRLYNEDTTYDALSLVDNYVEKNKKHHVREILKKALGAVDKNEKVDAIKERVSLELESLQEEQKINLISTSDLIDLSIENASKDKYMEKINTGLELLDLKFPMYKGGYYVIGARTSMGKSHLALFTGMSTARQTDQKEKQKYEVIFYSLEMTPEMQFTRIAGLLTGKDSITFQTARGVLEHEAELRRVKDELPNLKWDFGYRTVHQIDQITRIRRPDMVIVDFIGEVKRDFTKKREEEVSEISGQLKAMGKKYNCAVLALSQLNRAATKGEVGLENLSLSSSIEHNADGVIMLNYSPPEGMGAGDMEIKIKKNRLGQACDLIYKCDLRTSKFWEKL